MASYNMATPRVLSDEVILVSHYNSKTQTVDLNHFKAPWKPSEQFVYFSKLKKITFDFKLLPVLQKY